MTQPPDAMLVLTVRLAVRARLWKGGEFETIEQVMWPLYQHARQHGLLEKLGGIDGIDRMMENALGVLQGHDG